jgi:hypothetical protein
MHPGNRFLMATSKSSGDIQFPNCPLTPGFGIGTASRCDSVLMNVFDSTLATSRGSVCANTLISNQVFSSIILKVNFYIPILIFRQRLDDPLCDQNVQHESIFFIGSIANMNERRLTQFHVVFQKSQHLHSTQFQSRINMK